MNFSSSQEKHRAFYSHNIMFVFLFIIFCKSVVGGEIFYEEIEKNIELARHNKITWFETHQRFPEKLPLTANGERLKQLHDIIEVSLYGELKYWHGIMREVNNRALSFLEDLEEEEKRFNDLNGESSNIERVCSSDSWSLEGFIMSLNGLSSKDKIMLMKVLISDERESLISREISKLICINTIFNCKKIDPYEKITDDFIMPNECLQQRLEPIIFNAPPGAVVSVGTHRSFNNLGFCNKCNFLLIVDRSINSIKFSRIVTSLLRRSDTISEFVIRANSEEPVEPCVHIDDWNWFRANWIEFQESIRISLPQKKEVDYSERFFGNFGGWHFLQNMTMFSKIKECAVSNRIFFIKGDLNHVETVLKIKETLTKNGVKISVLDLSNIITFTLKGIQAYSRDLRLIKRLVQNLIQVSNNGSMLVSTNLGMIKVPPRRAPYIVTKLQLGLESHLSKMRFLRMIHKQKIRDDIALVPL